MERRADLTNVPGQVAFSLAGALACDRLRGFGGDCGSLLPRLQAENKARCHSLALVVHGCPFRLSMIQSSC
jgi:hypothetical protein